MFTDVVWFNSVITSALVTVVNPEALAETLYLPTGTLLIRYSPTLVVTELYFTLVSRFVAMIVALGTAAPVESVTVPTNVLAVSCPKRSPVKTKNVAPTRVRINLPV
jgi:hypothetical protein